MQVPCATCGEPHDLSDLQIGYDRPDPYFAVNPDEREARWELDEDLGVLDGERRFVRGVVEVPVHGEPRPYAWGVWAAVAGEHFRRYEALWDDPERGREPPFPGRLATQLPGYPQTLGLAVTVRLGWGNARPSFTVDDPAHPLAVEQRLGVPLERVLEMVSPFLHRGGSPPLGEPRPATLADDRWELLSAVELYRAHEQVYWLPAAEERGGLENGWIAKLPFRIAASDEAGEAETHVERMWVEVDHRRESAGGVLYSGELVNDPYNPGLTRAGMRVWFAPEHVMDIGRSPDEPLASEGRDVLRCGRHGPSFPAYVCGHLVRGESLGFHAAEGGPDDPRPDAWCDACEAVLDEEGEWNDRSEAFARITLVCGGCYDVVEARNRRDA